MKNKSLRQYFRDNKDKKFYFYRIVSGNYGDDLINMGADNIAVQEELDFENLGDKNLGKFEVEEDAIIYVHGSGGIGRVYPHVPFNVFSLRASFPNNEIVIGPTTVCLDKEISGLLDDKNLVFFAREKTSYDFLKSSDINLKKIYLDECPSFSLKPHNFGLDGKALGGNQPVEKALFLRNDPESAGMPPEIKKEQEKCELIIDPCKLKSFNDWVLTHLNAEEIITNRTHSAILGVVLGKKVKMFANYYHKNRSVYEYSLKKRGVEWVGKYWTYKKSLPYPNWGELK